MPSFTIITVCFNNLNGLMKTAATVLNQSCQDFQYLIVDGASSDGTLTYLKELEKSDSRVKFVSEKDAGIYDAMNKGVTLSTGKYINFLNGGDLFTSPKVLEQAKQLLNGKIDVLYSDSICNYFAKEEFLKRTYPLKDFFKGMPFVHQSAFIKTEYLKAYPYDLNYKIAADFDFFSRLKAENCVFSKSDNPIAIYEAGGLSDLKRQETLLEYRKIAQRYFKNYIEIEFYFRKRSLREYLISWIRVFISDGTFLNIKRFLIGSSQR